MTNAIENNDHEDEAINRLAYQFKDKPRIAGLITSFVEQYQIAENVFFDLIQERTLFTAVGDQLDGIGAIVGEARKGRNDTDYRLGIMARIAINTSKGTPENFIAVFALLVSAGRIQYFPYYPAEVEAYADVNIEYTTSADADSFAFDGGSDGLGFGDVFDADTGGELAALTAQNIDELYLVLQKVLPGGVRLNYIGWFDGEEAFGFEGDPDSLGFGDALDVTVGGNFAKIVPSTFLFSMDSDSERTFGFGDDEDNLVGGGFDSV